MHSSNIKTLKLLNSIQPHIRKTIIRTLLNPFGSKPIEKAKDAHSNLLTDTENVFELQYHTVKPSAMVKYILSFFQYDNYYYSLRIKRLIRQGFGYLFFFRKNRMNHF